MPVAAQYSVTSSSGDVSASGAEGVAEGMGDLEILIETKRILTTEW